MTNKKYNNNGLLISFLDDHNNIITLEYDEQGRIHCSKSEYDKIIYFYDNQNRVCYQEVFDISNKLLRKIWLYYNKDVLDHIVSDDGIDIWIDENFNKIN